MCYHVNWSGTISWKDRGCCFYCILLSFAIEAVTGSSLSTGRESHYVCCMRTVTISCIVRSLCQEWNAPLLLQPQYYLMDPTAPVCHCIGNLSWKYDMMSLWQHSFCLSVRLSVRLQTSLCLYCLCITASLVWLESCLPPLLSLCALWSPWESTPTTIHLPLGSVCFKKGPSFTNDLLFYSMSFCLSPPSLVF